MKCAYCEQEAKGTKEHIISCSILDIFSECYLTIDSFRGKIYQGDPMIKDVCSKCNNEKISYIDSYAKDFISNYFIKKYKFNDVLNLKYNYTLIQKMLLKYAFNDLRSHKDDVSFFNQSILEFLMDEKKDKSLRNVTILAGLAVNTSPLPDYMFGNKKIRWGKNPILLSNSIIEYLDSFTGELRLRKENKPQEFKKLCFSYLFRFNSVQFLLLCWDDNISDEDLNTNKVVLQFQYPYTILSEEGCSDLSRCTSEVTYHNENLIDVSWGQGLFDDISYIRGTYSEKTQNILKEIEDAWKEEELKISEKFPR